MGVIPCGDRACEGDSMIPRIIHYCWFGGNDYPDVVKACIWSWRQFCPDYQIVEWNEDNFNLHDCPYSEEAYLAKKWAFVSDYARVRILYEYGGIYMDTDVEVLKDLTPLLENKAFLGFEAGCGVNSGLIAGSEAGLPFYRELLDLYRNTCFNLEEGSNLTSCVEYTTDLLEKHGLEKNNRMQIVEGIRIYPMEFFCPMDHMTGNIALTGNTYTYHKYSGSWAPERFRVRNQITWECNRKYGTALGKPIGGMKYLAYLARTEGVRALGKKLLRRLRKNA